MARHMIKTIEEVDKLDKLDYAAALLAKHLTIDLLHTKGLGQQTFENL